MKSAPRLEIRPMTAFGHRNLKVGGPEPDASVSVNYKAVKLTVL
jgi:hypothetical protein